MTGVMHTVTVNQLEAYKLLLYPRGSASYHIDFFTTFDYYFIDVIGSYNKDTDGTWEGGIIVKVIEIFIKCIFIALFTVVKVILFVTVITPLVLKIFSMYHNRSATAASHDFEKKAVAFVKASEAYSSFGCLEDAVNDQANQNKHLLIDCSQKNAVTSGVKTDQLIDEINQNLLDSNHALRTLVQDRASHLAANAGRKIRLDFFKFVVQDLESKGSRSIVGMNSINAKYAMFESFIDFSIKNLITNSNITAETINHLIEDCLFFFPCTRKDLTCQQIIAKIMSRPDLQHAVLMRTDTILAEVAEFRNLDSILASIHFKLNTVEDRLLKIEKEIAQLQSSSPNHSIHNPSRRPASSPRNSASNMTPLQTLQHNHNMIIAELYRIEQSIVQEAISRENGVTNSDNIVIFKGCFHLTEELRAFVKLFSDQPQSETISYIINALKKLDNSSYKINLDLLRNQSTRTESQKLTALHKAVQAKSCDLYSFILQTQMTDLERNTLYKKIAYYHDLHGSTEDLITEGQRLARPAYIFRTTNSKERRDDLLSHINLAIISRQTYI